MKWIWLPAALICFSANLSSSTSYADEKPSDYSEEGLQEIYLEHLAEEGFRPEIDKDGDVAFKYEGGKYYIDVDAKDPQFFRLVYPAFFSVETESDHESALAAIEAVNRKVKSTKVYIVKDRAWATIELFITRPEDYGLVFERSLSALKLGVKTFVEEMRGEN